MNAKRILLVGCSGIDPIDTFSLARNHWFDELALVGEASMQLAAATNSLLEKWSLAEHARVYCGSFEKATGAAIAVLNPYAGPCIAESRMETAKRRATRLKADIHALGEHGFDGIMLIIAEPVDVLASIALKTCKMEPFRVMGIGANYASISEAFSSPKAGGIWCTGTQGNTTFMDQCDPNCSHFEPVMKLSAAISPGSFKYSGNRFAGMALCVSRVCEAILRDEREVLPVSVLLSGQYGIIGAFMTVPCVLGRDGVERIVELPVAAAERRRMQRRAAEVIDFADQLGRPRGSVFSAVS